MEHNNGEQRARGRFGALRSQPACARSPPQHEEICRDEDFFGITFPDESHPASAFAKWYAGPAAAAGEAAVEVREVDARWPHSAKCWVGVRPPGLKLNIPPYYNSLIAVVLYELVS